MSEPKPPAQQPLTVYRRLLGYAAPHWRVFFGALAGMGVFAAADVSVIGLLKPLLDGSFVHKDPHVIRLMPFAIVGLFLVRGLSSFGSSYGMAWVGRGVIKALRGELFEHLLRLPARFFDRSSSGALIARLTYHVEQVSEATTSALTSVFKDGLTVVGLLGLMLWLNWEMTLFVLVVGPVIAVLVRYVSRRFRRISARIQESVGGVVHAAEEAVTGQRVVKVYGGEEFERAAFARVNELNRWLSLKMTATQSGSSATVQIISSWAIAGVVYFATQPDLLARITPGTFASFLGAMMSILSPLKNLSTVNERMQRGIAAATDIFALLAEPPEPAGGARPLTRAQGLIEYRNVRFRYAAESREVLHDISLTVQPGQSVAFVGRSGSGKSTLLSLLPRFYGATAGEVRLDGHDIRDYPVQRLRAQIALVDQQVRLFNATVAQNIAYGLDPPPEEARVIEAAKAANAWDFIRALPQGLHTRVGQDGVMLSGGERQRVAIARALLKDAPILILDEATSALDSESERAIQQALERLVIGRTTLVIAHRLSTIQGADLIVVMQDGRIKETGRHAELLARGGLYATLHRMQFEDATPAAVD